MGTNDNMNYFERIREYESRLVCEALTRTQGHQRRAAQLLGLSPTTLSSLLQRLGIDARSFKERRERISLQTFERLYLWKSDRAF
jgi:DNA-binding NtrC family response regulator